MISINQTDNTVAFPHNSNTALMRKNQSLRYSQENIQLLTALQTSLEIPKLLEIFYTHMKALINIHSVNFHHEQYQFEYEVGNPAKHSCHYHLEIENEQLGELIVTSNKRMKDNELELLEFMIGTLICPVRNAILYQAALKSALLDPLTGANNRISLENTLQREIGLAKRHNQPLSMIVLDIDFFKSINDNFGHIAGDCVLKDVVKHLQHCCRDTDTIYRYGGEEFVILLNKTDTEGAMVLAERLRKHIEDASTTYEDNQISITISQGVTSLDLQDNSYDFFNRADKALYEAKRNGRNQTVCF